MRLLKSFLLNSGHRRTGKGIHFLLLLFRFRLWPVFGVCVCVCRGVNRKLCPCAHIPRARAAEYKTMMRKRLDIYLQVDTKGNIWWLCGSLHSLWPLSPEWDPLCCANGCAGECECEMYKRKPVCWYTTHMVYKYSRNGFDVMWKSSRDQHIYKMEWIPVHLFCCFSAT